MDITGNEAYERIDRLYEFGWKSTTRDFILWTNLIVAIYN